MATLEASRPLPRAPSSELDVVESHIAGKQRLFSSHLMMNGTLSASSSHAQGAQNVATTQVRGEKHVGLHLTRKIFLRAVES